jgi:hypothetical protein
MLARLPFVFCCRLRPPPRHRRRPQSPHRLPARTSLAVQMLAGSWALRVDGAIVFRFDLVSDGSGWSGSWARPARSSPMARASPRSPVPGRTESPERPRRGRLGRAELRRPAARRAARHVPLPPGLSRQGRADLRRHRARTVRARARRAGHCARAVGAGSGLPPRGVAPGPPVRFNMAPVVVGQGIAPRRAPAETQGPPAIEGR